jgi:hypothetical protein
MDWLHESTWSQMEISLQCQKTRALPIVPTRAVFWLEIGLRLQLEIRPRCLDIR